MKWGRAVVHAQALEADISAFVLDLRGKPFGKIRHDYKPKRHGFAIIVDEAHPIPPRWNLMLGDVASNLRSCVDHIAWTVVQRGTKATHLTKYQESKIYFPITRSLNDWNKVLAKKLPGVRPKDRSIIRRAQPWRRGNTRVEWHALTVLEAMVNADKHREMLGVWMMPDTVKAHIVWTQDCEPTHHKGTRALMKVDAEIGFIKARETGPNPDIQVQYELSSQPAFHPRLWLQQWLNVSTITIMRLLNEFGQVPDSIQSLGINWSDVESAKGEFLANAALWEAAKGQAIPNLPPS